ncbi:MAG: hypothetical protein LBH16_09890 [Treponema sp.]|jgi:hypothetical protein|nr:hypothetical protein [Treponema sp.]
MIDNICIKIPRYGNDEIIEHLQDKWQKDTRTYSEHIQNMGVYISLDSIIIHGSLAKYFKGENIIELTFKQVKEAIKKLENDTGINFESAIITSIECGMSLITKEQPSEYMKLFCYPARYTRCEYATMTGVETVTYSTPTGAYQFSMYNKIQEVQKKKKQSIPAMFNGVNILRLEYKIVRRRGIKAKFNRDLTAYDLLDFDIYQTLQNLFIEAYQAIPKSGWQCHIETKEKVTPKVFNELVAEQYRQMFPKEYLHFLKVLKESGALTDKNIERIRAANRAKEKMYTSVESSPLIRELDDIVLSMVRWGVENDR